MTVTVHIATWRDKMTGTKTLVGSLVNSLGSSSSSNDNTGSDNKNTKGKQCFYVASFPGLTFSCCCHCSSI